MPVFGAQNFQFFERHSNFHDHLQVGAAVGLNVGLKLGLDEGPETTNLKLKFSFSGISWQ